MMLLILCFLNLFSFALSICYYPNGDIAPQDTTCSNTTNDSFCCGQGYACLSNKICMGTSAIKNQRPGYSTYVRGSCTDKTWVSSACPSFCLNPNSPNKDNTAGGEGIAKCQNTSLDMYYCIDFATSEVNCTSGDNVLIFQGSPSVITTIGVTATTAIATSVSTTLGVFESPSSARTSPSTSTPSTTTPSPKSHAAAIGAGVSVPVAIIVLGLLGIFIYRKRQRKRWAAQSNEQPIRDLKMQWLGKDSTGAGGGNGHEPVGSNTLNKEGRSELPGQQTERYELH